MSKPVVGGGPKKVLYALQTATKIGLKSTAKALTAKNTCKACGLGMGGQKGGMTNEAGDFPSVCNKSIQAQSTDIQPGIPIEVLTHPLSDLRELDGHELEHLGRLATPLYKPAGADRFEAIGWDAALDLAGARMRATAPDRSFFYSSGRSSNEAGFILQLLARAWGTNNVNNCSYYCHQATGVGLGTTIGTGTSTVELEDLDRCDFIFVIGANPASNHPRFIHKLKAIRDRGGEVVIINPAREAGLVRFALPKSVKSMVTGGDWIASDYLQPRIGSDLAVLKGLAKAVLVAADGDFIAAHTTGFEAFLADIEATSWDEIECRTGLGRADLERVAGLYAKAGSAVFAWGMGITHHLNGCDNVEYIANLAMLRGQIGRPGAGLLPLRGHSNVQGIGTIGVKPVLAREVLARMEQAFGITLPQGGGMDTMACMQAAQRGEIDAAVLMGGNLFEANPDSAFALEAMGRIGFKLYLTTTLNRGHVHGIGDGEALILPVTARDEEWQPTTQESMFNFVRLSDGGIHRFDGVRPESDILCDLAQRLMPDSPVDFVAFKQHRTIREAIARIVPGMEDLADIDVARQEFHVRGRLMHTPLFHTIDGKGRFVFRPLPPAEPAPLLLTTVRSEGQFNTIIYEYTDSYRGGIDRNSVMLHADDLAQRGLQDGDVVTLESDHGRMDGVTVRAFDIAKGSVMAYYPEANVLVGTAVDPRSKTPAFKATPVRIVPR
ncbi:molybdopterin dinucleotide binding domain protein [Asticcacaulis biprosthecium C19]|uniref:Molybdopterin dinucleotide binding domain protein n=1 Tax=Asticcacaulis biprosthecium C19 TaxID=715226 RepID=F4QL21_9CAUL|nr:FdhF/YdeP family oxidoreductase [Asticcacaulis biprosthecium]EGF92244.1 molybdopterin dinucleotide binding domain protein [Asticcacaulis biprosthecium C19]